MLYDKLRINCRGIKSNKRRPEARLLIHSGLVMDNTVHSLLDNVPNFLLGGCVIQRRSAVCSKIVLFSDSKPLAYCAMYLLIEEVQRAELRFVKRRFTPSSSNWFSSCSDLFSLSYISLHHP